MSNTVEPMVNSSSSIISSKGEISATFQVPGLITIPSDGAAHNVTIAELPLDASMSWVAIPKKDTKAHLKVKITNTSDYTLLEGTASMFVDGSFTSRSFMPAVSPQEPFELDLGLDPSIRITYHPRSKQFNQTGAYWRQITSQNAHNESTVVNSKTVPVKVKVIDQIPVSEDPNLTVKLVAPGLTRPNSKHFSKASSVPAGEGVVAEWEGSEELDPESLGKDGNLNWICSIPPQGKVHLNLQWEVTSSEGRHTIVDL